MFENTSSRCRSRADSDLWFTLIHIRESEGKPSDSCRTVESARIRVGGNAGSHVDCEQVHEDCQPWKRTNRHRFAEEEFQKFNGGILLTHSHRILYLLLCS
ncbi:hypothetical protein F2P79_005343 [Pimephales promelas]|nr:hypothetical protein F2P79_005343 [Pimephales promelas]